ncbi:MAG TPA: ThuA domain-containing protein [Candidatus Hydrogenedentes bacterium]|nr:ThuA domain-containing protein [Candidatus Hydrogenedentota bacterium]HQM49550.1 ThuA domain-containing protein [Candidatus Hydrogenedentota bacterium]
MRAAIVLVLACAVSSAFGLPALASEGAAQEETLRVVVVTGGHSYDKEAFEGFFKGIEGIEFVFQEQKDHSELFEDVSGWDYDVIVFYSMTQNISEKRQQNLISLLDEGVGVVALHHIISGFNKWPEFQKIIGARYLLEPVEQDGKQLPGSTYQHDVEIDVKVADPLHPVTKGVAGFKTVDETYKGCLFEPDNHVLLTTDNPASDKSVGWVRTYKNARVCTIQLGHGPSIFADPQFKKLVVQAVKWTAKKTG